MRVFSCIPNSPNTRLMQDIISGTNGYEEHYGPYTVNRVINGNVTNMPSQSPGHQNHIHISVPW